MKKNSNKKNKNKNKNKNFAVALPRLTFCLLNPGLLKV